MGSARSNFTGRVLDRMQGSVIIIGRIIGRPLAAGDPPSENSPGGHVEVAKP